MKRVLTALVALPILLYTVWSSIPHFFVVIAALSILLALGEFYNLASKVDCKPLSALGYLGALGVIACFYLDKPAWIAVVFAVLAVASLAVEIARPDEMSRALASASVTVFGVVYVALLAGHLVGVRMTPDTASVSQLAPKLLTMFFAMVMMTDTGAYYTGRTLGRHKLAPRVSPGKTVEGSIGGFIAAALTGPLVKLAFFPEVPMVHAVILGAMIGLLGQIGDLAESLLKRGSGVKDSGNLLPGHGGMLDRVDSILFCAPLVYYYSRFFLV